MTVKILRECVDKVNEGNLSKEEYAAIMDKYYPHRNEKVDKVTYHLDHRKVRDFGDMLTNAFFRQTSKLGIKFFQTHGIKVIFQWTNNQGQSMDKSANKTELKNKWWLDGGHRNAKNRNKYGSITFSEMRQVQRMEKELGEKNLNVIKTKGSRDSKINNLY